MIMNENKEYLLSLLNSYDNPDNDNKETFEEREKRLLAEDKERQFQALKKVHRRRYKEQDPDVEKFLNGGDNYLKQQRWDNATIDYLMALRKDPEEVRAYIGLLLAEMQITKEEDLINVKSRMLDSDYYRKACIYGGKEIEERLNAYASGTPVPEKKSKEGNPVDSNPVYEKGDVIRFGIYKWIIVSVDRNIATLLCLNIVDEQTYSDSIPTKKSLFGKVTPKNVITWAESDLRKWLNEKFIKDSFNAKEQSLILNTNLNNPANPDFRTKGGDKTTDRIFLLSLEEARAMEISLIQYEIDKCPMVSGDLTPDKKETIRYYWLRTPGKKDETPHIAYASYSGEIFPEGKCYNLKFGVRPMIKILIE